MYCTICAIALVLHMHGGSECTHTHIQSSPCTSEGVRGRIHTISPPKRVDNSGGGGGTIYTIYIYIYIYIYTTTCSYCGLVTFLALRAENMNQSSVLACVIWGCGCCVGGRRPVPLQLVSRKNPMLAWHRRYISHTEKERQACMHVQGMCMCCTQFVTCTRTRTRTLTDEHTCLCRFSSRS